MGGPFPAPFHLQSKPQPNGSLRPASDLAAAQCSESVRVRGYLHLHELKSTLLPSLPSLLSFPPLRTSFTQCPSSGLASRFHPPPPPLPISVPRLYNLLSGFPSFPWGFQQLVQSPSFPHLNRLNPLRVSAAASILAAASHPSLWIATAHSVHPLAASPLAPSEPSSPEQSAVPNNEVRRNPNLASIPPSRLSSDFRIAPPLPGVPRRLRLIALRASAVPAATI